MTQKRATPRRTPPASDEMVFRLVSALVGHGKHLLAAHAELGPRKRLQALRRDRLFALLAESVDAFPDAQQRFFHFTQQALFQAIAVQEQPLLVALLAQIAGVGRIFQPRDDGRRLVSGHSATQLGRLFLQCLQIAIHTGLGFTLVHGLHKDAASSSSGSACLNSKDSSSYVTYRTIPRLEKFRKNCRNATGRIRLL